MQIKRYLSVLLAVLLLASDSGVNLFGNTCGMSKHTVVALHQQAPMCGAHQEPVPGLAFQKKSCCHSSSTYLRQPVGANCQLNLTAQLQPLVFAVPAAIQLSGFVSNFAGFVTPCSSPPYRSQSLSLLQVFRC